MTWLIVAKIVFYGVAGVCVLLAHMLTGEAIGAWLRVRARWPVPPGLGALLGALWAAIAALIEYG
ncbi:hypothetical protein [Ferrovibrio sp.]|uniref:hypothetical protein n=1 Tax=Ferrovibrio sp. TaxID=1917215 RepID=UPI00311F96D4